MFIVTLLHNGETFFLRSTVWSSQRDRAQEFSTVELAFRQIEKAKQFQGAKRMKLAKVEAA